MTDTAIVTGGGRGIGAATAGLLGERGFSVAVNYRTNRDAAERVAAAIREAGGRSLAVQADIGTEAGVLALFEAVDSEFGAVSALVNNAAIVRKQSSLAEMSETRIASILKTNVAGTLLCCREAVRRMSTARGGSGGSIVNVFSVAARTGSPFEYVDYAASKGAVDSLTRGLAVEVANEGIRVNGVRPGFIYTDMHADGGEADRVDRLAAGIPMRRGGQPAEVALAILWLLSDEASYVTGSIVDVAGGR